MTTGDTILTGTVELLTAADVGRLLKCSRSQVYKMRSSGLLPLPLQLFPGSRGVRWLRQDVENFILQAHAQTERDGPRPFTHLELAIVKP